MAGVAYIHARIFSRVASCFEGSRRDGGVLVVEGDKAAKPRKD